VQTRDTENMPKEAMINLFKQIIAESFAFLTKAKNQV
jgi:hypothetical protein